MKCAILSIVAVVMVAGLIAVAEPMKDNKSAAGAQQPQMQLPPGWTADDMKACAEAAIPGPMHARLAQDVGKWEGKSTMWMAPDTQPMTSPVTATFTSLLDGRYVKCDMAGEMPGMGPYNGMSVAGFDNVSKQFTSTWIDNCGTGMALGTGTLSPDGKTLTWTFTYNCPIQKKAVTMRQIETNNSPTSKTLEMFGADPKSGKEFQMMKIELTKK